MATSDVEVAADVSPPSAASGGDPPIGERARRVSWPLVGLVVACAVPFVVALVALAHPTWYPTLDLAHTSLRVRDVFSSDPPLVGLPGRIGSLGQQGSHPGPLSFWALAPLARLFGGSTWALQAATATLNVIAVFLALWMARRRGGTPVLLGVGAALAVLLAFYGPDILTEAWNPYLPVMWWFVFLIAVWSVWCDDFATLPVLVFAASFCLQTHISYAGLASGLSGLTAVWLAWSLHKRWSDRAERRSLLRWIGVSAALGVPLWLPPVIQQLTGENGNIRILYDHFTNPPEEAVGFGVGIRVLLVHLNPWRLVSGADAMHGAVLPGALFGLVWAASAVGAWRLRARTLIRLDLVVGIALVLAFISASRIFGFLWFYLVLWTWSITVLMLVAIGWSIALAVGRRMSDGARPALVAAGWGIVALVTVAALVSFTFESASAESPDHRLSEMLRVLVPPTEHRLDAGTIPGCGPDGKYLITWTDPVSIGAAGFGLVDALDRRGFDVGVGPEFRSSMTRGRSFFRSEATCEVHLAIGQRSIEEWRAKPKARQVAFDGQSARERAEYRRLRAKATRELRAAGLPDLAPVVDDSLFMASIQPNLPDDTRRTLEAMLAIGQPAAMFVEPTAGT
ncbi:MAG: hypothetical protein ACXVJW_14825 [Acidimicrobiia bacterium]